MISVKRIFVAGVVSLFIVLSPSCIVKTPAPPPPVGCKEPGCEQGLNAYLLDNKSQLSIQSLSISNGVITTNISGVNNQGVSVNYESVHAAIKEYIRLHPLCDCLNKYTLTVYICPSPGACTQGFRGTISDPLGYPPYVISINTKAIEKIISAEAIRLGVMTKGLRVELKKDNKGNQFLLVSGEVGALNGSASQGKQTVIDQVKKYTGGLTIDTASLKELHAQR